MQCEKCDRDLPESEFPDPGLKICSGCLASTNENPNQSASPEVQQAISGFWRRTIAFIIDGLILGVFGSILGFFAFDALAGLGAWGRLLGFFIALVYFGILDSSLAKGQTLGKVVLGIRLVDRNGHPVSVARSMIRYTIVATPFFLNKLPANVGMILSILISFIVVVLGGSIIYLLIFNRRTRQSVHDLATKTYVVRSRWQGAVKAKPVWRGHYVFPSVLLVLVIVFSALAPLFMSNPLFKEMLDIQKTVSAQDNIRSAEVMKGVMLNNNTRRSYFRLEVLLRNKPDKFDDEAVKIARLMASLYPEAVKTDVINVTVLYGYDIGIAYASRKHTLSLDYNELQELVKQETL